jgi:hypothetical protein
MQEREGPFNPPLGRCQTIAALPPDVRKGSAFPSTRLNTKAVRLGRLPESHRLSADQAAQPQGSIAICRREAF